MSTPKRATDSGVGSIHSEGIRISLRNVAKIYGPESVAVRDVNLEIAAGAFVGLLGPSGSGKTTTLNLIAGLDTPTEGTVEFDGVNVSTVPAHKRNIGMLFQNYALFPHMTVAQNIAYPLRERKTPKAQRERLVKEALELVQLTGRERDYPRQLSGGQQQRVALARSIVFNPKALLLDEPLGALDKNLRASLQSELRRIHRDVGATFVFVTHDHDEAMTLANTIVLFRPGAIEQVGSPEDLYQRPNSLFAAKFFGDSNTFAVTLSADGVEYKGSRWASDPQTLAPGVESADSVYCVVHPEETFIASPDEVPVGKSFVTAVVVDREYSGSVVRIIAHNALDDSKLVCKTRWDTVVPPTGSKVALWWEPSAQRIVRG